MKASARPLSAANAFQSYLRAINSQPTTLSQRRTLCTSCLIDLRARTGRKSNCRPTHRGLHSAAPLPKRSLGTVRNVTTTRRKSFSRGSQRRTFANVNHVATHGPLEEYDERVHSRKLRDDEHQRSEAFPVGIEYLTRPGN